MFCTNMIIRNISRHRMTSILTCFICTLVSLFLSLYLANISASQKQLERLPDVIPVSAHISNISGSRTVGLMINGPLIESISNSNEVRDLLYTTRLAANLAPETPDEETGFKEIAITGMNTLSAFPLLSEDDIVFAKGSVRDFLSGQQAGFIVQDLFLQDNRLEIGDSVELSLYCFRYGEIYNELYYEKVDDLSIDIVGSFSLSSPPVGVEMPVMFCAAGWVEVLLDTYGLTFYADSVGFIVQDPHQLNEFKAKMKDLGLMSINPQADYSSVVGTGLSVNDETFIQSATSLQKNLTLMRTFLPLVLLLIILIGYIASYLMMISRRPEIAQMRSLGVGHKMCAALLSTENAALALLGCLIGVMAASLLTGDRIWEGLIIAAAFFLSYMCGVVVAVLALGRFSVMKVLIKTE